MNSTAKKTSGGCFLWKWKDEEITNPRILRSHLDQLVKQGFSGIFTNIGNSRYDINNPRTLRLISQVSQWARKRNLDFLLQIDPRQNSRPLIYKTGERTKNILLTRKPHLPVERKNLNIIKIKDRTFHLKISYSDKIPTTLLQDKALSLEPHSLEKVFLFQLSKGTIVRNSIKDITHKICFSANIVNNWVEIFGIVNVPSDQNWYVAVFPKFNTNMYDFAGRESNDILLEYIEDIFDAFVNLDGIIWGKEDFGYISGINRIPVSLSIYNSFTAEYGYDLRDFLLSLILKLNDNSHIQVRLDYYNLLMELIYDGIKEFHCMLNSFFHGVDISNYYSRHTQNHVNSSLLGGNVDPWKSLDRSTIVYSETTKTNKSKVKPEILLTTLIIAKSLSAHSKKKKVYHKIDLSVIPLKELSLWLDLMSLYSVDFLLDDEDIISKSYNKKNYSSYNKKINKIKKITGFNLPESDYAFIFPIETIMASDLSRDKKAINCIYQLIAEFILTGIQLDVISPVLLKNGKITDKGLEVGLRHYKGIIYPFPDILCPQVLNLLPSLEKSDVQVLLGGNPRFTTDSKIIDRRFNNVFDPYNPKSSFFSENGIKPLLKLPDNCIGSVIRNNKKEYILLNPARYGKSLEGQVNYKNYSFTLSGEPSLVIYELSGKGKFSRVL
ncbi:MAG: hypothetical protein R6V04_04905 [bacterium]